MNTRTTVLLELKQKADRSLFENAFGDDVQEVNGTHWRFETTEPEKLKKRILEFSLLHNLDVVSLQSEQINLEDVFRTLTQDSAVK
jgi:hypothetical protein